MRIAAVLVLVLGCSHPPSDCEQAVHHVLAVATSAPPGSKPSHDEQDAIDAIAKLSVAACDKEGLSAPQRDCLLALKTLDDLQKVADCPAIAAHHPSWLLSTGPAPTGSASPGAPTGSASPGAPTGSASPGAPAGSAASLVPAGSAALLVPAGSGR